jgi:hypothetical protein
LGSAFAALLLRRSQTLANWRNSHWLIFTQLLFYPMVIGVGAAFRADTTGPIRTNPMAEFILDAITITSLAGACFWIYRMKGLRWLASSLVLFQEVVLFGALFIAGMSVTGDWI